MSYQYEGWPDETHLYATTLDDISQFKPEAHFHFAEKLPWIDIHDTLRKYPSSAETTDSVD